MAKKQGEGKPKSKYEADGFSMKFPCHLLARHNSVTEEEYVEDFLREWVMFPSTNTSRRTNCLAHRIYSCSLPLQSKDHLGSN